MATFNGKEGRWVTTKDGRKVFLEGETEPAKDNVAFRIDTSKWGGNQSANDLMIAYLRDNKIPYKFNKYFELTADLNKDGDYKTLDYAGEGKVVVKSSPKKEDMQDKQEREIKEREEQTKQMTAEMRKPEEKKYKFTPPTFTPPTPVIPPVAGSRLSTKLAVMSGKFMSVEDVKNAIDELGKAEGLGDNLSDKFKIDAEYVLAYDEDGAVSESEPIDYDEEYASKRKINFIAYSLPWHDDITIYFGEPSEPSPYEEEYRKNYKYYRFED